MSIKWYIVWQLGAQSYKMNVCGKIFLHTPRTGTGRKQTFVSKLTFPQPIFLWFLIALQRIRKNLEIMKLEFTYCLMYKKLLFPISWLVSLPRFLDLILSIVFFCVFLCFFVVFFVLCFNRAKFCCNWHNGSTKDSKRVVGVVYFAII